MGEWVASLSDRNTRPGTSTLMGGFSASITRIWPGLVWDHFDQFIRSLSGQVSEENADLPERVASEAAAKNNRTAIILGVIGIFASVIPAAGILLGILGLIFASKAAQQRSILSLVLPVLALAAGLLFFFAGFLI